MLIAELLHGDDWSENFVLNHLVGLFEITNHRRLKKVTRARNLRTTSDNFGVLWCAINKAFDFAEMHFVVERPIQHIFVWFASFGFLGLFSERVNEVTINFWTSDHARRRRAILSSIEVARHGDCLDCKFNIGVVKNYDWCFST